MRVLADLHGEGDPENEVARSEFREIKEGIIADVRLKSRWPAAVLDSVLTETGGTSNVWQDVVAL